MKPIPTKVEDYDLDRNTLSFVCGYTDCEPLVVEVSYELVDHSVVVEVTAIYPIDDTTPDFLTALPEPHASALASSLMRDFRLEDHTIYFLQERPEEFGTWFLHE